MKLHLNGEAFEVPAAFTDKLVADLLKEGEKDYKEKVPAGWRILGQALSRLILESMERKAIPQIGKQAAKDLLRPVRGEDPNLLLARVFSRILLKGLSYVEVFINTGDSGTVEAFNFTVEQGAGEARTRVDFDGSAGVGQNHRTEIS